MKIYSMFENTFFDETNIVSPTMQWQTQTNYYRGKFCGTDLAADWRFKAVPKKREQAKFIGFANESFMKLRIPRKLKKQISKWQSTSKEAKESTIK